MLSAPNAFILVPALQDTCSSSRKINNVEVCTLPVVLESKNPSEVFKSHYMHVKNLTDLIIWSTSVFYYDYIRVSDRFSHGCHRAKPYFACYFNMTHCHMVTTSGWYWFMLNRLIILEAMSYAVDFIRHVYMSGMWFRRRQSGLAVNRRVASSIPALPIWVSRCAWARHLTLTAPDQLAVALHGQHRCRVWMCVWMGGAAI